MTVNISKPAVNVREKLAELDKPTGIAGEAMLRAETPQEQFNLIGAGRRNLIINGAMQVWQRGTSAVAANNNAYQSADRWFTYENSEGAYTEEQSTGHTADTGFYNALKLVCTGTDASIGSTQYASLGYRLESNDVACSGWGTSSAQDMVLSFWVRSNKTGVYSVSIAKQSSTAYRRVSEYTIDQADTWKKIIISIPALTLGGAIPTDNTQGIKLEFCLAYGATYKTSTLDTWTTSAVFASTNQVNWFDTTSNNFYITGVQLEVGKVATPFEHRSIGEELALCQRFYTRMGRDDGSFTHLMVGSAEGTNAYVVSRTLPTPMRAIPSVTVGAGVRGFTASSGVVDITSFSTRCTRDIGCISANTNGTSTVGQAAVLYDSGANGYIEYDAEL